ncbi:cation:proton antiporter [Wenxinia marina]|uniref:Sodium/proton antiporter, CPA1 family n=1 Tax=Wenxinia marina DSM 24838 TaxID=1123501 RepID=A0A0D0QA20_9RHOB|nr:sodium:proton antiporter [Wenxinia marina]KIQ67853.1 sodium/proton antiporter, CPA1 family [Wenxinia marina DSM 24838]GGL74553.1 sodium:proton antiporter [Wenxinia marina]
MEHGLSPVMVFAAVGAIGVGSQWLAWRLRLPAIVLMLAAGVLIGPGLGLIDPARDIGTLLQPMIAVAVAIILFEGGLTLNLRHLRDAREGVRRLVWLGAPLGWVFSTLALRWGAGLSWESATVFGGIMIVTGPTVIAPLLRQARLARRPAQLLQWEAILNDPVGALAAVLAFEVVLVRYSSTTVGEGIFDLVLGVVVAAALGAGAGYGIARAFRRGAVPEFMKVPVLFALLLGVFALADAVLHESGLLAVTVMGLVIANSDLPSYTEIRRFKEYATVLLVSGVFVLLAASLDLSLIFALDWRAPFFVALAVLVARPATVFLSFLGSRVPWRERVLLALTAPRGVVLVAVAGLFGERLVEIGVADGAQIAPLAFALVAATVLLHGFALRPLARLLGLSGGAVPGVVLVGGSSFAKALAEALHKAEVPVLLTDPNYSRLLRARVEGVPVFMGDILSEAAEENLELIHYDTLIAATDNDAYNTLVATDLGPEFGRETVFQVAREKRESARHQLPATLGGRPFGGDATLADLTQAMADGWKVRVTRLTEEYDLAAWRDDRPNARLLAVIGRDRTIRFVNDGEDLSPGSDTRLVALVPPDEVRAAREARAAGEEAALTRDGGVVKAGT